jgi:ubiquitin C-terminal hydrolase
MDCKHTANKFEPLMYLSVPVIDNQKEVELVDCLAEFTREEQLGEDERWYPGRIVHG